MTIRDGRLLMKCDGTRAETRFRLSAKRTNPFKSAVASVQSTAGSRVVRISGSNAGYPKLRGSVKRCEGDWLPTPFASFPFTSPTRASPCAIRFQLDSTFRTRSGCSNPHTILSSPTCSCRFVISYTLVPQSSRYLHFLL